VLCCAVALLCPFAGGERQPCLACGGQHPPDRSAAVARLLLCVTGSRAAQQMAHAFAEALRRCRSNARSSATNPGRFASTFAQAASTAG
jgi:hypothetical protein